MILFKDRRTGGEIMMKGVALTPGRLATPDLGLRKSRTYGPGITDLHKLVEDNIPSQLPERARIPDNEGIRRREALWDPRVSTDLRNRIIDMQNRSKELPDGFSGGKRFHKDRNDLATEIVNREDLPAKLQRRLLQAVLDNAPITWVGNPYENADAPTLDKVFPGKASRV